MALLDPEVPPAPPAIPTETPGAPRVITPQETVAGQTAGLLEKGSPLFTQQETAVKEEYNKRGLLNSQQAVQTGQEAVISKALEIAKPDAATYAASGQASQMSAQAITETEQKGEVSKGLAYQEYALKGVLASSEADYAKALSKQEAGQNLTYLEQKAVEDRALSAVEYGNKYSLTNLQGNIDASAAAAKGVIDTSLENIRSGADISIANIRESGETARKTLESATLKTLETMKISSAERQAAVDTASALGDAFQRSYSNLMASSQANQYSADQLTAITANMISTYKSGLQTASALAGWDVAWVAPTILSTGGTTPVGTEVGTTPPAATTATAPVATTAPVLTDMQRAVLRHQEPYPTY